MELSPDITESTKRYPLFFPVLESGYPRYSLRYNRKVTMATLGTATLGMVTLGMALLGMATLGMATLGMATLGMATLGMALSATVILPWFYGPFQNNSNTSVNFGFCTGCIVASL